MLYILALILMLLIYAVLFYLMKYMKRTALANAIFVAFIFIPYVMLSLTVYLDVGFYDWNFQNTLPVANVSPFMFVLIPLTFLLPRVIRRHFLLLISLLSVGMFLSSVLGCCYNAIIGYKFHIHFTYDYVSHFAASLLGVYLIRSRQVTLTLRNTLISSSIIIGAAGVMLILNLILDTAFFGLSLKGDHSIYNTVLTESSALSAILYFTGLAAVLTLGYVYMRIVSRKCSYIDCSKNSI